MITNLYFLGSLRIFFKKKKIIILCIKKIINLVHWPKWDMKILSFK